MIETLQPIELLQRSYDVLKSAEGYFFAAAFDESSSPPYKRGAACDRLDEIRALLADLQRALK